MKRSPFVAALFVSAFALKSANADVQTINQCTVIDQPGSYRLQKVIVATERDLTPVPGLPSSACILVDADFVTLDLQGYTIIGQAQSVSLGIASTNRRGIKVHSGVVTGNFDQGVLLVGTGHTVENIAAIENRLVGMSLFGAGHRLIGNIANNNGFRGIVAQCPSLLLGNMANQNPGGDIVELGGSALCRRSHNSPFVGDIP